MPTTRLVALAALLCAGAAGTGTSAAGEPGLETRVDALERRFTAELRQAEDRMAGELTEMGSKRGLLTCTRVSCKKQYPYSHTAVRLHARATKFSLLKIHLITLLCAKL